MSRRPAFRLTNENVGIIKQRLYDGDGQTEIALSLNINPSTVNRIAKGVTHTDVPWPDGSTGRLVTEREKRAMSSKPSRAEMVRRRIEETIDQADSSSLMAAAKGKATTTEPTTMPWPTIEARDPDNPLVLQAKLDPILREVLSKVFAMIPPEQWQMPSTTAVVRRVAKEMGYELQVRGELP